MFRHVLIVWWMKLTDGIRLNLTFSSPRKKWMKTFFGGHTPKTRFFMWPPKKVFIIFEIQNFRASLKKFGHKSFAPPNICLPLHLQSDHTEDLKKTVLAACPASCSTLTGRCKGAVHTLTRRIHCESSRAVSGASKRWRAPAKDIRDASKGESKPGTKLKIDVPHCRDFYFSKFHAWVRAIKGGRQGSVIPKT